MMPASASTEEATKDELARYAGNVDRLRSKLATIATHHRDIFTALNRMAAALRQIEETYRN